MMLVPEGSAFLCLSLTSRQSPPLLVPLFTFRWKSPRCSGFELIFLLDSRHCFSGSWKISSQRFSLYSKIWVGFSGMEIIIFYPVPAHPPAFAVIPATTFQSVTPEIEESSLLSCCPSLWLGSAHSHPFLPSPCWVLLSFKPSVGFVHVIVVVCKWLLCLHTFL